MKSIYVKVDERNRIALTKATKTPYKIYKIRMEGETIILEPVIEAPKEQHWLFKPENKHLLAQLEEGLKQEATISRGSFAQYATDNEEDE